MAKNSNLHAAKAAKNDEFYTRLEDVERELFHYREHFRGKTVLLNCDDPKWSAFWRYFHLCFKFLGLKKLISTHYEPDGSTSYALIYENPNGIQELDNDVEIGTTIPLKGNGDFRSEECIELLKEADVVVTNPPFSLFREYVAQLVEYNKKFIIIGNQNAITYKEIFPLIKENKLWLGYGFKGNVGFFINQHYEDYATSSQHKEGMIRVSGVMWFTNLEHKKRHEPLLLWREYAKTPEMFPHYDNYDAINVDKVADIPMDYDGVMGVPITFLDKWCPEQFEILGTTERWSDMRTKKYSQDEYNEANDMNATWVIMTSTGYKKGYKRLLIRHRKT